MSIFSFVDINQRRYTKDKEPNECPQCHYAVQPEEIAWTLTPEKEKPKTILEVIYQCPRNECKRFFVARYRRSDEDIDTNSPFGACIRMFILEELVPRTPQIPPIPKEISDVSPLFPEIYAQSIAAESYGLGQIAGVGYRKALEFLIKDYCGFTKPESVEAIKSSWLSTCINDYVDSPQIKLCAERAEWLGNDEAHYVRKWSDKDLSNLKELIILAMNWIHSELLTRKYEKEMPKHAHKK
jgi:hypothetical protein